MAYIYGLARVRVSTTVDHDHPATAQVTGEARPIRPGPLNPDTGHSSELRQPPQQLAVPVGGGRERLHPQEASDPIQRRSDVQVQVSVNTTSHGARGIYDRQRHPFLSLWSSGWHSRQGAAGGSSCCRRAIRRTTATAPSPKPDRRRSIHRQADRQPALQVRSDPGEPTVTTTRTTLVDPPISHKHILPAEYEPLPGAGP